MIVEDKKTYTNDSDILEIIADYVKSTSYNYAILIDGLWGCGKTHFVHKTLIPSLKSKYRSKKIIYISLYGVATKEEITQKLIIETLPFKGILKDKKFNVASKIGKTVMFGILSSQGISLPQLSIELSDIKKIDNCVVFFDDLERCGMEVNETLGYISEFVENDGIKCIIVANESEIATTKKMRNLELKYLVAANRDIECVPKGKKDNGYVALENNTKKDDQVGYPIDSEALSSKANLIFGNDELYAQVKEKIIGQTIYYRPEMADVIEDIVSNHKPYEPMKDIIMANIDYITEKFNTYKHHNIRTVMFCFDKFQLIYAKLSGAIPIDDSEEVFNEIFRYTVAISIKYKMGMSLPEWSGDNEIKELSLEGVYSPDSYIKGFRFVDELVCGARFDKVRTSAVIDRHLSSIKSKLLDKDDPLFKLGNSWWYLTDDEAKKLLMTVNTILKEEPKKYDITHYSKILMLNIIFKRLMIVEIELQDVLDVMTNNLKIINVAETINTFGVDESSFFNKEEYDQYRIFIGELNREIQQIDETNNTENLNSIFNTGKSWASQLSGYAYDHRNEITKMGGFISKLDYSKLLPAIKNSTSEELISFRRTLQGEVYNFSNVNTYFSSDLEPIQKLSHDLQHHYQSIKSDDKIKAHNLSYLIIDLDNLVERLR